MKNKSPLMLMILDGLGLAGRDEVPDKTNAFVQARTPNLDRLLAENPHSRLEASHSRVGLPDGQMGNSEVGHLNIGAGRIVYQDLVRISRALENDSLKTNPVFQDYISSPGNLHLMGLVSPGGVHSHNDHLLGLVDLIAREAPDKKVFIHCFLDGRDTPPQSAAGYLEELEEKLTGYGQAEIVSVIGRLYAMDRDNNWDRVEKAYRLMTTGRGESFDVASRAVRTMYEQEITDEFMEPLKIGGDEKGLMSDGDGVLFFNFRGDRAREITIALAMPLDSEQFPVNFSREDRPNLRYFCMNEYHEDFGLPLLFEKEEHKNLFGEVISRAGLRQLRIAETEKYAHVTFFFNGGTDTPFPGEERILVNSPKVKTYDLKPEMSAFEVTDRLLEALDRDEFDVIILNFANPDMVGHTGVLPAAIKAVEAVDTNLGRILSKLEEKQGSVLITADHGNCEQMLAADGSGPHTAHTTNPVFLIYDGPRAKTVELKNGKLADLAPTMLRILGLEIPPEMDGEVLISGLPQATGSESSPALPV